MADIQGVTSMALSSLQYEQPFWVPEPIAHGMALLPNATGAKDIKAAATNAGEKTERAILKRTKSVGSLEDGTK